MSLPRLASKLHLCTSSPKTLVARSVRPAAVCVSIGFIGFALACQPAVQPASTQKPPDSTRFWFEDVTAGSGVAFRHRHGGDGQRFMVETMGSGGGLVDLDNNGSLDIVLLQGHPLPDGGGGTEEWRDRIWFNDGNGSFREISAKNPEIDSGYSMGMCAADVDEDGDQDVFVTRFGADRLLLNDGSGLLQDATESSGIRVPEWSTSCAFADYDRDGCLDLAIATYVDFSLETHRPCRAGDLPAYCHPDVYGGLPDRLFRGQCDGTFVDRSKHSGIAVDNPDESKGLGLVWLDYDDDGWIDLYVSNDSTRNFLWRNAGNGTFVDVGIASGTAYNEQGKTEAGMGVDAGDIDGDGRLDLVVANLDLETNTAYRQLDPSFFEDATRPFGLAGPSHERVGFGVELFDADLDGDLDLFIANGHIIDNIRQVRPSASYGQADQLFENLGSRFESAADSGPWFDHAGVSRSVAAGDLDGDGDQDLLVTSCNQGPAVLMNRIGDGRSSLVIDLRLPSGRAAVGARVDLTDDLGRSQIAEVRAGSGYLSQGSKLLHFGLGEGREPRRLDIRWPDGRRQVEQLSNRLPPLLRVTQAE